MKYEFIKIDDDTTKLRYKGKEYEIKKNVGLIRDMQSIPVRAKTMMMLDLSKQGITAKDLIIERKEGNKTYIDNSNIQELEKAYNDQASVSLLDELSKKYVGIGLIELIQDIELDEKEMEQFSKDFVVAFSGISVDSPSETTKDYI